MGKTLLSTLRPTWFMTRTFLHRLNRLFTILALAHSHPSLFRRRLEVSLPCTAPILNP